MRIAVDAMGGDHAPGEIVKGAVAAAAMYGVHISLVGDQDAIRKVLPRSAASNDLIDIRHTSEVIEMCEPAAAFRTKKDASMVVCAEMVREGEAQAMISAGNTAATMAVATFKLGRIEGIERPAIAIELPARRSRTILIDAGANADCDVANLVQFALMGSIYAEKVMSVADPKVALLSIGEEECKGNELTKSAHAALRQADLNFIGNVEGRHLFSGEANVIVCDGFTGNVALKSAEAIGDEVKFLLKRRPLLKLLLSPVLLPLKKRIDYSEHGGAPLLGVNGICVIGHGRSNARAVSSAVRAAVGAVEHNVISSISASLCKDTAQSIKVV
ncbi:MAG: phosphate acyltransferase PlsX [Armatimonadota bacterium]|nr:phosphate acyltransferase PlsX [Armatimonadota bacterium]